MTNRIGTFMATAMLTLSLVGGTVSAATAASSPNSTSASTSTQTTATSASAACASKVYFIYNKPNKGVHITKGQLTMYKRYATCRVQTLGTWRAGSGTVKNSCTKNKGWLPNGTYKVRKYYSNHQGTIKGKAWYVSDHKCSNGTKRTELFIHTKKPWPGTSGYYSNGCVKVTPGVANKIASLQKSYGMPKNLYVTN